MIKEDKTNNCEYFKDFELHFLELNKLRKGAILKPKKLDAKRLKEMGLPKEQIAKATELSLKEFENLNY